MIDRRTLLVAAAALPVTGPLAGCAHRGAGASRTLKLVTFNIWHDAGNWTKRRELIVDLLRAADPDVIALQEVLQDSKKALPNQAETLAAALGGYAVRFASTAPADAANRYGNAILTWLPILATDMRKLAPLSDYRTALRVRVDVGGRPVDVVTTHLAWQPDQPHTRVEQINDLVGWLPGDGVPLTMLGDFNAPLDEPAIALLTARGLAVARLPTAVTTTLVEARGHQPRVIDHILFDRARFGATSAQRIADRAIDGEYPSDHFGVAATLTLAS